MPSPSESTPIFGFPYPAETDAPDVPTANQDLATAVETVCLAIQVPVGGVIEWYSDTLPAEGTWLFLHGGPVTEGSFPALAAAYPNWVSGGNIILPDTRDRFSIGAALASDSTHGPSAGSTGGSATVTLVTGNIPRFSSIAVAISDPGHGHTITISDPTHAHGQNGNTAVRAVSTEGLVTPTGAGADGVTFGSEGTNASGTGISASASSNETGISGTVTFGSSSPTPINITPQFVAAHRIVRAA